MACKLQSDHVFVILYKQLCDREWGEQTIM